MFHSRTLPIGDGVPMRSDLLRHLVRTHGEAAVDAWLQELPAVLTTWCDTWKMSISGDLPDSGYNVMLYADSSIVGRVVLKMNLPSAEVDSELEAITQASGHGIVRLIDADPDIAIMMLERVSPGTLLKDADLTDRESTAVGVDVMRRFWRKPTRIDHLFPLREWIASLLDYPLRPTYPDGPIPARLIDRAIEFARYLLNTQTELVLLHGDIHHYNIIWGGETGWITIDPKGLIGERGFDTGTWMHNPVGIGLRPDLDALLRTRLATFAGELGLDPRRIAQWSFMFLVLSMCWTTDVEGYGDLTSAMNCALEMERIMDELANHGGDR